MDPITNSGKPNLVVLTDFSVAADNATRYAINLAQAISANICLLHIWDNSILNPDYFIAAHPYNSEKKIINALRERCHQPCDEVSIEPVLIKGTITDKLRAFLKKNPNALVIIGKRYTENTPDEMVSSTSVQLLDIQEISLLIVPERFEADTLPQKIGFGWDGLGFALKNKIFSHLFNSLKAELVVIHVARDEEKIDSENYLDISQELLGIDTENASLEVTEGEPVAGRIHARSAIKKVDLLTLVIRKRPFINQLFHTSVTAEFIRHASIPILILHG